MLEVRGYACSVTPGGGEMGKLVMGMATAMLKR